MKNNEQWWRSNVQLSPFRCMIHESEDYDDRVYDDMIEEWDEEEEEVDEVDKVCFSY